MDVRAVARRLGYPVVVKPARGAGCCGVGLARNSSELAGALAAADRARGTGPLVMQRYVPGRAASVSLLANGRSAVPLAVNAQRVTASAGFSYRGGVTPFDHPLAAAAASAAARTCAAIPGLRGYVGVDLVLADSGPVVIEVNPRLTMSYLGVRAVVEENIAAMAIAACRGILPAVAPVRRRASFSASGRVRRS
jgi:predicted ATP-grasp superfamily ATP-dependent carboligase